MRAARPLKKAKAKEIPSGDAKPGRRPPRSSDDVVRSVPHGSKNRTLSGQASDSTTAPLQIHARHWQSSHGHEDSGAEDFEVGRVDDRFDSQRVQQFSGDAAAKTSPTADDSPAHHEPPAHHNGQVSKLAIINADKVGRIQTLYRR